MPDMLYLDYTDHNVYLLYRDLDGTYVIEKDNEFVSRCYNTTDALDEIERLFKRVLEAARGTEYTPKDKSHGRIRNYNIRQSWDGKLSKGYNSILPKQAIEAFNVMYASKTGPS